MLSFLPATLRGILASLILFVSTLCWATLLFCMTLVKILLPFMRLFAIGIAQNQLSNKSNIT